MTEIKLNPLIYELGFKKFSEIMNAKYTREIKPYSIDEIIYIGVSPKIQWKIIKKGFINFETGEYDTSVIKTIEDFHLLLDFYIGTILLKCCAEIDLRKYTYKIEVPKALTLIVLKLSEMATSYFKIDNLRFHVETDKNNNQIIINSFDKKDVPLKNAYCFEFSR